MAYFINVFLEVDYTANEETLKLLKARGNYFEDRGDAVKAQKLILRILRYGNLRGKIRRDELE